MDKNSEDTSLESLMHLSQQGDKVAYAKLLTEANKIICSYLYSKMLNTADIEDVAQEILLSVHSARHTYDKSRPFKPWLFSIIKFRLIDYLRKIYKKKENEDNFLCEESSRITINNNSFESDVTNTSDRYEELYEALAKLSEKQSKIVKLMKIEGYSAREVAKMLDMSESAVKVAAHRAYKALQKEMLKA